MDPKDHTVNSAPGTNPQGEMPFRVLFVDDDRAFLEVVRETFNTLSEGHWIVLTASDAATTSVILKQQLTDLIVLDMRMPEISGLQLISILNREHPAIPKVFLTGLAEASERVAGLESGAALCLEKPTGFEGFQSIYATLNELVKWHRRQAPRGAPRAAQLLDLIKLECTSGNSRLFEVVAGEVRGLIYIKDGAIIHSESPGRRGQSAFTHLAALPNPDFNLRQFVEPPERSIYRQWEFLFLEAVQLQEQTQQTAAEARTKPAAPPPPPAPAREPRETEPPSKPGEAAAVFQRHRVTAESPARSAAPPPAAGPLRPTAPPPAKPAATTIEPLQLRLVRHGPEPTAVEDRPILRAAPPAPAAEPPAEEVRILESLVCSTQREVLYEWQCDRPSARLELVDNVRERFDRISQHLPVGEPDRLEVQSTDSRTVVQYQTEGAIFFRSNHGIAPSAGGGALSHQSMAGWLARHSGLRGLLASGVLRPGQQAVSQSCSREYPREPLSPAWRCVQEVFELFQHQSINPWQLRWVFEHAQLYVTRRQDGKALAMFLSKDPDSLDTEAVERVFNEFKSLEAP